MLVLVWRVIEAHDSTRKPKPRRDTVALDRSTATLQGRDSDGVTLTQTMAIHYIGMRVGLRIQGFHGLYTRSQRRQQSLSLRRVPPPKHNCVPRVFFRDSCGRNDFLCSCRRLSGRENCIVNHRTICAVVQDCNKVTSLVLCSKSVRCPARESVQQESVQWRVS